jgi:hypothetical protein
MGTVLSASSGLASRLCMSWVHWYTRRLPDDVSATRRDEIASDLWEQSVDQSDRSPVAAQLEVMRRLVFGVPADLAWRQHVLATQTKGHPIMQRLGEFTGSRSWTTLLALLGAAFLVVVGSALIITGTDDGTTGGRIYGAVAAAGGLALLAGVHGFQTRNLGLPLSRALVVVGALVLGVGFWWFLFVPAVIAALVTYFGVVRGGLEVGPTTT